MRFVHISDTHIAPDPGFANYGHAPFANLEALVDAINALTFPIDFILHTGDVVEDRSEAAYRVAKRALDRLRCPIYYVAGNHDDADVLRSVFGDRSPGGRLDYTLNVGGVRVAVFDSRGPNDPGGTLTDGQLTVLRALCTPDGPPLVVALHHPPLPLESPWLDNGWVTMKGTFGSMLLDRSGEFLEALAPARDRIRGVFFGHVHRAFHIAHGGILFSSAPSGFAQLLTWPNQDHPQASPVEPAGFNLVSVTAEGTVIQQCSIPRPS